MVMLLSLLGQGRTMNERVGSQTRQFASKFALRLTLNLSQLDLSAEFNDILELFDQHSISDNGQLRN